MILRFFKTNQPAASFAIPLVVLMLWLPGLAHPVLSPVQDTMPLYQWLFGIVKSMPLILLEILAIVIVSFQAIYIHHIVVKHDVLYQDSYLPSIMFAVLASCLPDFQQFSPVLVVNLIMLFVINKSFAMFKEASPIPLIFDSGFLIAIASLIYLPAILFFILFLVALLVLRPFSWREWIVAFIGFLLPYFFISVYFFWIDGLKQFYNGLFSYHVNLRLFYEIHFSRPLTILTGLIVGLLVLSLFKLRDNFYKNTIKTRIVQQVTMIYLFIGILAAILQTTIRLQQFQLLAFPLAVFFGYYFLSFKRRVWMSEVFFLLIVAAIIANFL